MGDSDDDYENLTSKRRGKFRKEREDSIMSNNGENNLNEDHRRRDRPMINDRDASSRYTNNNRDYHYRRDRSPKMNINRGGLSPRQFNNRYPPHSRQQYSNRSMSPPPMSQQQSRHHYFQGNNNTNDHYGSRAFGPPSGHPHHDNPYNKRVFSPPPIPSQHGQYYKPHFMPGYGNGQSMHQQHYNDNRSISPLGVTSYYDQEHGQKRQRRDWPDDIPNKSMNYFSEHDNRSAPGNPNYSDKYNDDFPSNRSNRPPYYDSQTDPSAYNLDTMMNMPGQHNDAYHHNNTNHFNILNNNSAAPTILNNMPPMLRYNNHFAPIAAAATAMIQNRNISGFNNQMSGNYNNNSNNYGNNYTYNKMQNNNNLNFEMGQTQPAMLAFKQFLSNLNTKLDSDSSGNKTISAEMATKRYNEYKNEFRCEQIKLFFDAHKLEEWFKQRYHPDISAKRKDEQRSAIKRRLLIFTDLLEKFNQNMKLSLDMTEPSAERKLFKFLDACMIKLEDGTDEDLQVLDEIYKIPEKKIETVQVSKTENKISTNDNKTENTNGNNKHKLSDNESGVESNSDSESDDYDGEKSNTKFDRKKKSKKIKTEMNEELINAENKEIDTDAEILKKNENFEDANKNDENVNKIERLETKVVADTDNAIESTTANIQTNISIKQKTQSIFFKHLPVNVIRKDLEEVGNKHPGFLRASISEPAPERRFQRRGWITFGSSVDIKDTCSKINGVKLHDMMLNATINRELDQKVKCIIGLTNHKQIVRNDLRIIARVVENMDKRWGLWQFNKLYSNNKLNDDDFQTDNEKRKLKNKKSAEVESDNDKTSEKNESEPINENLEADDAENILKLPIIDEISKKEDSEKNECNFENPLVKLANFYLAELNITSNKDTAENVVKELDTEIKTPETKVETSNNDLENSKDSEKIEKTHKIDEKTEPEKKNKLPVCNGEKFKNVKLEKDEKASELLDNLILYLRIVHSIDYYNATEYQQEDWMPNRCGVLHVRGSIETKSSFNSNIVNILNGVNINYFDPNSIKRVQLDEWIRLFEMNIKSYYEYRDRVDIETAKRLGLKDFPAEIDKYIKTNTQKVEKDVWLCLVSAKKFKSPDYVKKHIETKHRHKLLELREDVEFLNRFVYDPKRPYLPEHPMTKNMGQSNYMNYNSSGMGNNNLNYNNNRNFNGQMNSGHNDFQRNFNGQMNHGYMNNNSYSGNFQNYHQQGSVMSGPDNYSNSNGFRHGCGYNRSLRR